jgi:hypothetical protein
VRNGKEEVTGVQIVEVPRVACTTAGRRAIVVSGAAFEGQ